MVLAIVAVVGLLWGSFANVLIARVPAGENWISESSRCPGCEKPIAWYDNVPVVSWLALRARCRRCGMRISARYPLVEIITSLAIVGTYLLWGLSLTFVAFAYLAFVSIVLAIIDIDTRTLPRTLIYPSYAIGAVLIGASALADGDLWSLVRASIGFVVLGGFYYVMWGVYKAGMGFGDVRLAGLLGTHAGFLGWYELGLAWFAGPIIGGVVALVGLIARRLSGKSAIPYGPALIGGAWIGFVAGDAVVSWYLRALTG